MQILDAHAHCGIIDRYPPQSFDDYLESITGSPIRGAVMFSPVAEIYDRDDPFFTDTAGWRRQRRESNAYLLSLEGREIDVYPYFFIWNDFAVDQLSERHHGIKWHRHADEPVYHYDDPACRRALGVIRERNLPVVLEEELAVTERFITEMTAGINVVIPHLGMLNGGYRAIAARGLWENPRVWTDTALASPREIADYIENYGPDRLLFGSDFPFGHPPAELGKVTGLKVCDSVKEAICSGNLLRLFRAGESVIA